jgi:hypothetical protein
MVDGSSNNDMNDNNTKNGGSVDLNATFRAKASFMKGWKPASAPSVRSSIVTIAQPKTELYH